ncbi:MAG: hypothetical protein ACOYNL_01850 [Rickettsiales bacterium]
MKKLLATLAVLALATPAFAGTLVDAHGNPIGTKDNQVIATTTDSAAPVVADPAPKAKVTKHKKKAAKKKPLAKKAPTPAAAVSTPPMPEPAAAPSGVQY